MKKKIGFVISALCLSVLVLGVAAPSASASSKCPPGEWCLERP
ncbi:hypothetical protein [Lysinibacillus sp. Y5S-8]